MRKTIAFLCVFMYFTSPYRVFGHAMPEVIGLIAIVLQLIQSHKVGVLTGYRVFMLYMLFIPPIVSFIAGLPGNYLTSFFPVSLLFYTVAFYVLLPNLDMNYVLKYYKYLVYISVGLFIMQELSYYSIGTRPTLYLPLEMYYEGSSLSEFTASRASMERSSSFFLEPAHFAQYILPYYCLTMFKTIKKKALSKEFMVLTLTFLFLKSGSGYVGFMVIYGSVLFLKGYVPIKVKFAILSVIVCALIIVVVFFISNPFLLDILLRLNEVTSLEVSAYGSQSGFLRIWRGYFIYDNLAPIYKILGVGTGSFEYVSSLTYIPGSRFEGSFFNGIQTLLVSGGIIGTVLFFRFIYIISKRMSREGSIIIICMISLFFVEHMMFTPKMFLFILIAFAVSSNYRHAYI